MSARRQQIIEALETRLATISTGNGYLTNGGTNARTNPDKETEPTGQSNALGLVIRETGGQEIPGMVGENHGTIELELSAHATAYKASAPETNSRNLWADLMAAIGTDKTLGGLCDDFISQGHEHSETQGGKRLAVVRQSFRIHYRCARWNLDAAPA